MTTLYPQTGKHLTNILFPKHVIEQFPNNTRFARLSKPKPEILHIESVFPFDLFPNSLIVDSDTVTIIHRSVPPIEHIETIPIEIITDVSVNRGMFLAALVIVCANIRAPITMTIARLRPQDALCAHQIIECLMSIKKHGEKSNQEASIPCSDILPN